MVIGELLSGLSSLVKKTWDSIIMDRVKLSVLVLILSILFVLSFFYFVRNDFGEGEIRSGVFIELTGMLADVIILVLLFNWLSSKGEKKRRIEHLKDEIEDFVHWNSEEAKYRIRGNLYRLNKEGTTDVTLRYVSVTNKLLDLTRISLRNIDLSGSSLLDVDFSECDLTGANFSKIRTSSGCTFNYSRNDTGGLIHAKFVRAQLQYSEFKNAYLGFADFTDATLVKVDFTGADLRGAIFQGTRFENVNLDDVEVSADFRQKVENWQIQWHSDGNEKSIFEDYKIEEQPVTPTDIGYQETFQYFLRKINRESLLPDLRTTRR